MRRLARSSALCLSLTSAALGFACRDTTPPPAAGPAVPSTAESHVKARVLLDQALTAMGGVEALRALQDITIRYDGKAFEPTQGVTSSAPLESYPRTGWLVTELGASRFSFEQQLLYPGGFNFSSRVVGIGNGGFRVEHRSRSWSPLGTGAAAQRTELTRTLPHTLLLNLLEQSGSLRDAGRDTRDGRSVDLVVATPPGEGLLTLAFDAETHLFSSIEEVIAHPMFGDVTQVIAFDGYEALGAARLPRHRVTTTGPHVVEDIRYSEVTTGPSSVARAFDPPDGYTQRQPSAPLTPGLRRVADGVHVLAGLGYQMLVVEMADHVILVEAPLSSAYLARAFALVRAAIPDKPVRFVAVTHHHDDHAGGARQVMAEGATLITTAGNRDYFTTMANAPFTIAPDAWAQAGRQPAIETFEGQRVFEDGTRRLELIDIGPSPHTREMVIAWLPKERVVFQADLVNSRTPFSDDITPNEATMHFLSALESRQLVPAQVTGVHMGIATFETVKRAIAAAARLKTQARRD